MSPRGGKRKGAGRPTSEDHKVALNVSVKPRTIRVLGLIGAGSKSAAIDELALRWEVEQVLRGNLSADWEKKK